MTDPPTEASARACANIALAKYWGKADVKRNIPAVPSISLTLDQLVTEVGQELHRLLEGAAALGVHRRRQEELRAIGDTELAGIPLGEVASVRIVPTPHQMSGDTPACLAEGVTSFSPPNSKPPQRSGSWSTASWISSSRIKVCCCI